jgi:hypothetical protein
VLTELERNRSAAGPHDDARDPLGVRRCREQSGSIGVVTDGLMKLLSFSASFGRPTGRNARPVSRRR